MYRMAYVLIDEHAYVLIDGHNLKWLLTYRQTWVVNYRAIKILASSRYFIFLETRKTYRGISTSFWQSLYNFKCGGASYTIFNAHRVQFDISFQFMCIRDVLSQNLEI